MSFTIGSLFSGSGGFELAATMCGGTPVWASEVEPFPIAVTWSRFPGMKHLGSVTDVKGGEVEPVDVITFGSPCQDLSVAGKRAGLKHEDNGDEETTRSGLFMEAIRIIKEMRKATNGEFPKFCCWENVPGAFSSNGGQDFRTVLEELIKIVEPGAVMPKVPKNGWSYADSYCGEGWSLAYRVFDAQYWGVPQRRRRIYLVLDLGGECAGEVLFEREGLRGYFAEGRAPWQGIAADAQNCAGADDREGENDCIAFHLLQDPIPNSKVSHCMGQGNSDGGQASIGVAHMVLDDQGGQQITVRTDGKSPTLRAEMHGNVPAVMVAGFKELNSAKARSDGYGYEVAPCLSANKHDASVCIMEQHLFENHSQDTRYKGPLDVCPMLPAQLGTGGNNTPFIVEGKREEIYCIDGDKIGKAERAGGSGLGIRSGDKMYTLTAKDAGSHAVAYGINGDVAATLDASYYKGCGMRQGVEREVVAYCIGNGQLNQITMAKQSNTLDCMHDQQAVAVFDKEAYNSGKNATGGHYIAEGGPSTTLRTKHPPGVAVRYIVRRLTPTECARLQGFADRWAVPVSKDEFTDEEYRFWMEVRNTHAAITGKAVKDYTKEQMLKWYNGLHTDSSEYKLWGNCIALPNALYVMQGIADVLNQ